MVTPTQFNEVMLICDRSAKPSNNFSYCVLAMPFYIAIINWII